MLVPFSLRRAGKRINATASGIDIVNILKYILKHMLINPISLSYPLIKYMVWIILRLVLSVRSR